MNFTINSDVLAKRIATVSKAQSSKNALPVLDCILIESAGGNVRLTASDSENHLSCTLEAISSEGEMKIALDSRKLLSSIREIGDQPITISTANGTEVQIDYLNGRYNLMSQDAQAYPENQLRSTQTIGFSLDCEVLRDGLSHCAWAVANDELRPQMNGVYLDTQAESITMVGSDGHKLVRDEFPNPEAITGASFIILPKAIKILQSIATGKEAQTVSILVAEDKSTATFIVGEYSLSSRLVEKKYPNYNSVIPRNLPSSAIADKASLRAAVGRVLVFASSASSLLKFHFEGGVLTISSKDLDFSTGAEEKMDIEYSGDPISIGFNGEFLKQVLGELPGESVHISMADPARAVTFEPEGKSESGERILMLLMPIMLQD